jgi:hypothetical protein
LILLLKHFFNSTGGLYVPDGCFPVYENVSRLTSNGVQSCFGKHSQIIPKYDILLDIATEGAFVDTDPSFVRRNYPSLPRRKEVVLAKVFALHAVESVKKRRGIIIKGSSLCESDRKLLHFSPSHWTAKPSVVLGRCLIDASNSPDEFLALNGGLAKELSIKRYGKVCYPELHEIIRSWLDYKNSFPNIPWSKFFIYKLDVKSCFPQTAINPVCSPLFCRMLFDDYIFIDTNGNFGWQASPMVWDVVGKAILERFVGVLKCP